MKEILQDIVSHTHNLGFLNVVKITGEEKSTKIDSMADDRSVIMYGESHTPYSNLIGVFGLAQLNKLKFLVECSEYKENSKIEVFTQLDNTGATIPGGINFENEHGDFKNIYRFINSTVINEKIKNVKFRGANWDVEFVPSIAAIQRFALQANANSEHSSFLIKTENGNLKFIFGDQSSHGGEFIFAKDIKGKLTKEHVWPVLHPLNILKIADVNSCKVHIADVGALQITLDSGFATYKYIIPAQV